jgi:hypothetical protein
MALFHSQQHGSWVEFVYDVSSGWQLSAPLAISSQLQLMNSVLRQDAIYFRATCTSV